MQRTALKTSIVAVVTSALISLLVGSPPAGAQQKKPLIHDAEYYILDAIHGEKWKVERNRILR